MSTEEKKALSFLVTRPPNVPNANGVCISLEAMEAAVETLNKRHRVIGEYGSPSLNAGDLSRFLCVHEDKAALIASNFRVTDQGIEADISTIGPYGSIAQQFIDDGTVAKGSMGFVLRSAVRPDDVKEGVIAKFMPVAVDFVNLK